MKHKVFGVWFAIFIVWAFYRAYFVLPEWIDEVLIKPLIFAGPVLYLVLIREKKDLSEVGLSIKLKEFMEDLFLGVILGIVFALEGLLTNYLKYGLLSFGTIEAFKAAGGVVPFLILNLATSISEEILGRGFLFKRLYEISGKQLSAAGVSSFLFLLLHVPIMFTRLHLTGVALLVYPISILLLGIANSYMFNLRKSLVLPILIHTFWNMTVALYL